MKASTEYPGAAAAVAEAAPGHVNEEVVAVGQAGAPAQVAEAAVMGNGFALAALQLSMDRRG